MLHVENALRDDSTHDCELQQMLSRAPDIGSQIEHEGVTTAHARHRGNDGGPVYARQRLEDIAGSCHERTGIARTDAGRPPRRSARPRWRGAWKNSSSCAARPRAPRPFRQPLSPRRIGAGRHNGRRQPCARARVYPLAQPGENQPRRPFSAPPAQPEGQHPGRGRRPWRQAQSSPFQTWHPSAAWQIRQCIAFASAKRRTPRNSDRFGAHPGSSLRMRVRYEPLGDRGTWRYSSCT